MAMSDAQRERVLRYQAQREQYLATRARRLRESNGGFRMESKAKILGHPVHPMLIVFPLGLLATAVIFDIIHLYSDNGKWAEVSYYMIAAGIIGGLVAAVAGLIDWVSIPGGTRAKAIGLWHGAGNVIVVGLFAASWALRQDSVESPSTVAIVLSLAGVSLALLTGWLGGELVDRLGVGVDRGAHLDAPNSLSGRPASEMADDNLPSSSDRARA
jgi:uncharacterized membrane protein